MVSKGWRVRRCFSIGAGETEPREFPSALPPSAFKDVTSRLITQGADKSADRMHVAALVAGSTS